MYRRGISLRSVYIVRLFLIFFLYFLTAKFGLSLDPVGGFATLVWPPAGIALVTLLLLGRRYWPAITIAAFLVNFTQGATIPVALGIAFGNTLEAVVAVFLLRRVAGFGRTIDNLWDVLVIFIFGALISTAIAATIGTLSLYWGGSLEASSYLTAWFAWWIGDMLGIAIITPFALFWAKGIDRLKPARFFEALFLFSLLSFISFGIFYGFFNFNPESYRINYLIYIPLFLICLRFGPREFTTAMLLLSIISIFGTVNGYGIFVAESVSQSLLRLQIFIGVTVFTFLPLSILIQEKRDFEKRKDEFLAIASHELKTPLTTIKGYADILYRHLSDNKSSDLRYVKIINDQIKNLTKLINDMLDITSINTGKIELGLEEFEVNEFVKRTTIDIQKTFKVKRITFIGKRRTIICADKYKITQVLTNLLVNSLKYSTKRVIVGVVPHKTFVTISVKDMGVGIDKKDINNIFKRFYQAKNDDTRKKGLGLGLYISRQIVKQHGGKMWVKSVMGKGSTFYFTLPKNPEKNPNYNLRLKY